MMKIRINNIPEYEQLKAGWVEPLILPSLFNIPSLVRKAIIKSKFIVNTPENDSKFYHWIWDIKPHWCEECGRPLPNYWAGYISHIKTRGAFTEYRYDPLNINILCNKCHSAWEIGTDSDKKKMFIYWKNIEALKYLQ